MSHELPSPISFLKRVSQGPPYLNQLLEVIGFAVDLEGTVSFNGITVGRIDGHQFCRDENGIARLEAEGIPPMSAKQHQEFVELDRPRAAVHEAGHVVAAHRLGWKVATVSLPADSDSGNVELKPHDDTDEKWQLYLAAGAAAESIFYGTYASWGVEKDLSSVKLREKWRCQEVGEQLITFDDYMLLAKSRVEKSAIEAVANSLKAKCSLSGDDLELILQAND